jgi:FkbM family methyltransferase
MIPGDHEVFVDGGVLDLKTSINFIEWCQGKYDAIYAFEPDPQPYRKSAEILYGNSIFDTTKIHLFNAGLWSKSTELAFNVIGNGASRIAEEGLLRIRALSIDDVLHGKPATFIKLDIEGAELEVLKGAQNTIKTYRPRLAVCIYHKPEDIMEIPSFILSLVPDYKFYIRHYSTHQYDTVLLCVYQPNERGGL